MRGYGVIANPADAAAWYPRAAEQDQCNAQYELGRLLSDNPVLRSDGEEWFRVATSHDKGAAEQNRSLLFPNGVSLQRDLNEAFHASVDNVLASAKTASGNTTISFSDGSQLTLLGINSVDNTFFA